ncbi:MAG: tetratricopeptide repeat protein [Betaproteobacteria bacterium]|nr:tetratricopeptide repeat protein [Betaproteobacteria bacterium]
MIPVQQAFAQAFAHEAAGRADRAASIYRQILAAIPDHPGALLKLSEQDLAAGRLEVAREQLVRACAAALRQALPTGDLWLALGRVEAARRDAAAARAAFARALEAVPENVPTLLACGELALTERDAPAAEAYFRRAAARDPGSAPARSNLALALAAQRRWTEAGDTAREAVALPTAPAHAFQVAAHVALQAGRVGAAIDAAREGLARFPDDRDLLLRLVDALRNAGRAPEARARLEAALAGRHDDPALRSCLGAVLLQLGDPARASEQLRLATRRGPVPATTWDNLGLAERAQGDHGAAIEAFEAALAADPLLTTAATNLVKTQQEICAWGGVEAGAAAWRALLDRPDADPRFNPFVALGLPVTPAQQLAIARRWSLATLPPVAPPFVRARGDRLRVGYLSGDLHAHPTAYLMAGLFERHDRSRFDVRVYSHGPDDRSAVRARIRAAVGAWVDVAALDDEAAARRMRDDRLDVLVDLKGHTQDARLGILARRPAPCQLHYLGFPGTLGTDAIDGIVADDTVVPPGDERHFHERVHRLPRCYQVTDGTRELPDPTPRAALGLPADAVVLACFNQTYKLSREFFALWLAALERVPQAVLWLYAPLAPARANLVAAARAAGADTARIVFADALPQREHLARLRAADLVLDLLPYGSHTTGSDALWAGVPMLSCRGDRFAGRVGASLLQAVGLDELVAETPAQYGALLLRLAADREALAGYRTYLDRERPRLPLFDTAGFARDWEALLTAVVAESAPAPSPG